MKELEILIQETSNILKTYLRENQDRSTKVINYFSAKELLERADFTIPVARQNTERVIAKISEYLEYSVRTTHPLFNNQLNGGLNPVSLIADIITHVTNTSMATYEIAPMATLIELKLIEKLRALIGFTTGEGIMVTGGSNANMLAIHCARSRHSPHTKEIGNAHQYAIFVSEQAHYSFKKAVIVLGIGTDNLILVKSDAEGRLMPDSLEQEILKAQSRGLVPLFVGSTAGTTVLGAFDPIASIDVIAKKYGLWHHVDGAWGAPCLFDPKLRMKMEAVENADSFTWDAHKMMGTGLITSFFLTQHEGILIQANSGGGNKYLFHENENGDYDSGLQSLQCGRKVDCLKLWFTWQYLGDEGLKELVQAQMEKARYFYSKIKSHTRFKVLHEPTYLNVCFQIVPDDEGLDINQYNLNLRYKLIKEGHLMINFSSNESSIFFRMVFANNMLSMADIDYLVEKILAVADA